MSDQTNPPHEIPVPSDVEGVLSSDLHWEAMRLTARGFTVEEVVFDPFVRSSCNAIRGRLLDSDSDDARPFMGSDAAYADRLKGRAKRVHFIDWLGVKPGDWKDGVLGLIKGLHPK